MNYLQLAAKLRQKTLDVGTGPTTCVAQTGQLAKIVTAIDDAWTELQQEADWRWLRKSFTVNTTSGDGDYAYTDCTDTVSFAVISRFSYWYKNAFKCYLSSAGVGGEYSLRWLPWDNFRRVYRYGTQTNAPPFHVSEDPTGKFVLGSKPDGVYVVGGDYQIGPQILSDGVDPDSNIPEMPTRFHNLIVYRAMVKYGFNAVAPEAIQEANIEGPRLRSALGRDQLSQITRGASLA